MLIAADSVFFWLLVHSTGPQQRDTRKKNPKHFCLKELMRRQNELQEQEMDWFQEPRLCLTHNLIITS